MNKSKDENKNRIENIVDIIARYKNRINKDTMSRISCIPSIKNGRKKIGNIELFFDMIKDYRKKSYKLISLSTILTLIGSVLYLLFPYDVMPDSMGIVGFLDDFVIIAFALRTGYEELCAYKLWLVTRDLSSKEAQQIIDMVMAEFNEYEK